MFKTNLISELANDQKQKPSKLFNVVFRAIHYILQFLHV